MNFAAAKLRVDFPDTKLKRAKYAIFGKAARVHVLVKVCEFPRYKKVCAFSDTPCICYRFKILKLNGGPKKDLERGAKCRIFRFL